MEISEASHISVDLSDMQLQGAPSTHTFTPSWIDTGIYIMFGEFAEMQHLESRAAELLTAKLRKKKYSEGKFALFSPKLSAKFQRH